MSRLLYPASTAHIFSVRERKRLRERRREREKGREGKRQGTDSKSGGVSRCGYHTLPASTTPVNMTMSVILYSHIILQKSPIVVGRGPVSNIH